MTNEEIKSILKEKEVKHLYHANTVATACTFLENGGLLSRGYVEDHDLFQTSQMSDEDEIWKILARTIDGASEGFVESRIREGQNLADDLIEKLDGMLEHVAYIEERSPQII